MSDLSSDSSKTDLLRLTAEVVSAYLAKNTVAIHQVPELIRMVHTSLGGIEVGVGLGDSPAMRADTGRPAVPVRRSVQPEYIVCLEDGKKLKMLRRHLRTVYNMTPEQYRAKWNLAADYPMTAPKYAAQRSMFAKKIGLGKAAVGRKKLKKKEEQ